MLGLPITNSPSANGIDFCIGFGSIPSDPRMVFNGKLTLIQYVYSPNSYWTPKPSPSLLVQGGKAANF